VWDPAAEQELAELWMNSPDRNAVTLAADRIDQALKTDPEQEGESRPDGRRILLVVPLGVLFRVLPDDRLVRVLQVWRFEQHGSAEGCAVAVTAGEGVAARASRGEARGCVAVVQRGGVHAVPAGGVAGGVCAVLRAGGRAGESRLRR